MGKSRNRRGRGRFGLGRGAGSASRGGANPAGRSRKPRIFETLEARFMLSIDPVIATVNAAGVQAANARMVDLAFQNAANLSQYTPAQLEDAARWVVKTDGSINANNLFAETGLVHGSTFAPINNTFFALAGDMSSNQIIAALGSNPGVQYFYPEVPVEFTLHSLPDDPLFRDQWHLRSTGQLISNPNMLNNFTLWGADARVAEAWQVTAGAGVNIAVVDDGVLRTHIDLADNFDPTNSFDFNNNDIHPDPSLNDIGHGLAVAGIIGAVGDNGIGVTGVAHEANIAGLRILGDPISLGITLTEEKIYEALTFNNQLIDIFNNSWGPADQGRAVQQIGPLWTQALIDSVFLGRDIPGDDIGPLGNIHVNAAGNGAQEFSSSNHDPFASSIFVVNVSGFGPNDRAAFFAEGGSSVFVTAPTGANPPGKGITTLDLPDGPGFDWGFNVEGFADGDFLLDTSFTSTFNGTSASAPVVSGVVALMIAAARENGTELSFRDVKHILAQSSRRIDPTDFGGNDNGGWQMNARPLFTDPQMSEMGLPIGSLDPTYPSPGPGVPSFSFIPWDDAAGASDTTAQFAVSTNGAGFFVHDGFDFGHGHGAVDARLAVELAQNWKTVGGVHSRELISANVPIGTIAAAEILSNGAIIPGGFNGEAGFAEFFELWLEPPDPEEELPDPLPANTRGVSEIPIAVPANFAIEDIEVTLNINIDPEASDKLRLSLVSPDGAQSELTNWIKVGSIGPTTNTGVINHTFTTARHWGERTEGVGRIDPLTGDRIDSNNITGPNGNVTAGLWTLVIENWSETPAQLNGGSIDFHAIKSPTVPASAAPGAPELSGRIQGSIGLDLNQDADFNFSGIVALEEIIDGAVNGVPTSEAVILSALDPQFEAKASGVRVFVDLNQNGVWDEQLDEPSMITGADGNFYFDLGWNVSSTPGTQGYAYQVRFELPEGHTNLGPDMLELRIGVQDDDSIVQFHHDANFLLEPEPVVFEGNVFADFDMSGQQDAGDATASEFRVFIDINENGKLDFLDLNSNGRFDNGIDEALEPMQITGADGAYSLELSTDINLIEDLFGNEFFVNTFYTGREYYTVMLDAADGWTPTSQDVTARGFAGATGAILSPSLAFHRVFAEPGQVMGDMNFGVAPSQGSISGTVFNDLNQDRFKNAGEGGLAGFTVFLDLDESGDLSPGDRSVITGTNGNYLFDNLPAGTYDIRVIPGPGFDETHQTSPTDLDPGPGIDRFYNNVVLAEGGSIGGGMADFGFFNPDAGTPFPRDWGDLGAPYATTSADGGPSHGIVPGFFLGAGVSAELDGQPSPGADADDFDDGVDFRTDLVGNEIVAGNLVRIDVTASSDVLFLQGWIDFNGDGSFDGPGEHLAFRDASGALLPFAQQTRLSEGLNELTFRVPSEVSASTLAARFRYSEGGAALFNQPNGPALMGEVEDYIVGATISQNIVVPVAGDYNGDSVVDQADYNIWKQTVGSNLDLRADGNFDGRIDAADYTIWRDNLGATASASLMLGGPAAALVTATDDGSSAVGLVTMVNGEIGQFQVAESGSSTKNVTSSEATAPTAAAVDLAFDAAYADDEEEAISFESLLGDEQPAGDDEALAVALEEDYLTAS